MSLTRLASGPLGLDEDGSRVFRRRRFRIFLDLVDEVLAVRDTCRILDVGGEPAYWRNVADMLGTRDCQITLVNHVEIADTDSRFVRLVGDARRLGGLEDLSFDVVHSNSVIEHVGRFDDMLAMADEVRRLAPAYFVQTPYFWFPVEPHCSTAFFHWMPESVRISMLMRRPRGVWGKAPDVATALRQIQSNTLLDRRTMATLFPDAEIERERVFHLTKSLIAIRHFTAPPRTSPAAERAFVTAVSSAPEPARAASSPT